MNFTFTHRPETRKYNYKPQFYVPDKEKPTHSDKFDPDKFGEKLRSNWDRKRHSKRNSTNSGRSIIWMVFIIAVLAVLAWKIFSIFN